MKELRLRGINDMAAGQAYLPEFKADHNRRFARLPQNSFDARRPMRECENLDEIFTVQDERKVSENLTLNHKRVLYVLEDTVENRRLRGHQVHRARGRSRQADDSPQRSRYLAPSSRERRSADLAGSDR